MQIETILHSMLEFQLDHTCFLEGEVSVLRLSGNVQ